MKKEIIKSIEINIAGTVVKVSAKQCRELYQALGALLGEPRVQYTYWPYSTGVQTSAASSGTYTLDTNQITIQ